MSAFMGDKSYELAYREYVVENWEPEMAMDLYDKLLTKGEKKGYAKGTAAGIIKTERKYGASDSSIVGDLVDALSCTRDEAERMLRDAHE